MLINTLCCLFHPMCHVYMWLRVFSVNNSNCNITTTTTYNCDVAQENAARNAKNYHFNVVNKKVDRVSPDIVYFL